MTGQFRAASTGSNLLPCFRAHAITKRRDVPQAELHRQHPCNADLRMAPLRVLLPASRVSALSPKEPWRSRPALLAGTEARGSSAADVVISAEFLLRLFRETFSHGPVVGALLVGVLVSLPAHE